MKKALLLFGTLALLGTAGALAAAFEHGFAHGIGIDTQASQEYAFFSGFGTWLLAVAGYSGIVVTLTHHLNCHHEGCWRIGRHREGSELYCRRHHAEHKPEFSDHELLEQIADQLALIAGLLAPPPKP